MKNNSFKKKSVAIKGCISKVVLNNEYEDSMYEISQKLNRILYRQNMNKKLLEQFFANMGFPVNENVDNDNTLKQFYDANNKYSGRYD